MHGKHAYNSENDDDIKLLKIWEDKSKNSKQYEYAIKYWTIKDPLKRQTAKDNNINLIEFWNLQEVEDWLNTLK